jgi:hypothetical protein
VATPSIPLPLKPLDDKFMVIAMSAALGSQPLSPVPPFPAIKELGVYALYYLPRKPPTDPLLVQYAAHCAGGARPLYLGVTTDSLQNRLGRHEKKLNASRDFSAGDFRCRAMPCDVAFAELVERYLIGLHDPLWNSPLFGGFGGNVRGGGRAKQRWSHYEVRHERKRPYPRNPTTGVPLYTNASIGANAMAHLASTAHTPFFRFDDVP